MKAVLLISHGSRLPGTELEVGEFVKRLRAQNKDAVIEYAFLEIAEPSIPEGIDRCVNKGATEIIVLLNFLNAGKHVDEDIPAIIGEAQQKYPKVKFHMTPPVGRHDGIIGIFQDMIDRTGS